MKQNPQQEYNAGSAKHYTSDIYRSDIINITFVIPKTKTILLGNSDKKNRIYRNYFMFSITTRGIQITYSIKCHHNESRTFGWVNITLGYE